MSKTRTLTTDQDLAMPYRDWRWKVLQDRKVYVSDIDHIEYRFKDGNPDPIPVACLELTHTRYEKAPDALMSKIIERYNREGQRKFVCHVAKKLGCKAWIVIFNPSVTGFWIFNLTDDRGWWELDSPQMQAWIQQLEGQQ